MFCPIKNHNLFNAVLLRTGLILGLVLLYPFSPLHAQLNENSGTPLLFNDWMPMDTLAILNLINEGDNKAIENKDSAVSLYLKAIKESQSALFAKGIIQALRPVLSLLPHAESEQLLENLWFIATRFFKLKSVLPVIYNAKGKIAQLEGDYQPAADYYMKAIVLAQKYLPSYLGVVYNNYGSLLLLLPTDNSINNSQAMFYLDEALRLAEKEKDYKTIVCVLCNKGKIYRNQKQYQKSLDASLKGLALAQQKHLIQWKYVLLNNIGDLYYTTGHPQKALFYLKKSISIDNTNLDPYYRNMAVFTLGEVYFDLGDLNKSEFYFKASLLRAEKFNIGRDLMEANKQLSTLNAQQGKFQKAFLHLKDYNKFKDSLRHIEVLENIRNLSLKYQTAEQNKTLLKSKLHIAQQKQILQRNNRFFIISIAIAILILFLFYNRFRNKKRLLIREEQIKEMKAFIKGEEKERIRLAQDLHDGIGGMLAAINMNMNAAKKKEFSDPAVMDNLLLMIGQTTDEVRKSAHNLMPAALLRNDLKEALQYYCDSVHKDDTLYIDLNTYGDFSELNAMYVTFIFRTIQELIQNIIKHATAGHVIVSLEKENQKINIMVEDNGTGFDVKKQSRGFGLENLSLRLKTLGGSFQIDSEIGIGTSIAIQFEIKN